MEGSKQSKALAIEKQLIEAAKVDPARFAPIYDIYYRQIFLFIFKRIREEEITGDLTSKVFLKALLNLKSYQHMGFPFSSWLYRIASNEINMHYRNAKKTIEVEIQESDLFVLMDEIKESNDIDQQELVIEALNQLPLNQTELIELRFFEKMSFKEIGEILGISEGNAKIKVYRALDRVKKIVNLK